MVSVFPLNNRAVFHSLLSFDRSVAALYQEYEAVLHTLKALDEDGCATAHGLFNRLKEGQFLGVLFILKDVLLVLSHLSETFQGGSGSILSSGSTDKCNQSQS